MKTFKQLEIKNQNPEAAGWYNTDKGNLFYDKLVGRWSCRDDRVSEEYPKFWYMELKPEPINVYLASRLIELKTNADKMRLKINDRRISNHDKTIARAELHELTAAARELDIALRMFPAPAKAYNITTQTSA